MQRKALRMLRDPKTLMGIRMWLFHVKLVCLYLLMLLLPHVSANWWYCAAEGGYCDRPGRIRYGASGRYHYGNGPNTQGFSLGLHHAESLAAHRKKSSPESVSFFE